MKTIEKHVSELEIGDKILIDDDGKIGTVNDIDGFHVGIEETLMDIVSEDDMYEVILEQ